MMKTDRESRLERLTDNLQEEMRKSRDMTESTADKLSTVDKLREVSQYTETLEEINENVKQILEILRR